MVLQLILTFFALFIIFWFNFEVIKKLKGIPYCVSESYYALDNNGWHFTCTLLFECILLCYPVLSLPWALVEVSMILRLVIWAIGALFLFGIGVVAISPEYKTSKTQYRNHFIGSIVAMISSQAWVWFIFPWAYVLWIIPLGWKVLVSFHHHNEKCTTWEKEFLDGTDWLWWFEIGMFLTTYCALITKEINLL